MVAQERGDYEAALDWYRQCPLEIDEQLGDRAGMAAAYLELDMVAQDQADYVAGSRLGPASPWRSTKQLGDRAGMASSYSPARHGRAAARRLRGGPGLGPAGPGDQRATRKPGRHGLDTQSDRDSSTQRRSRQPKPFRSTSRSWLCGCRCKAPNPHQPPLAFPPTAGAGFEEFRAIVAQHHDAEGTAHVLALLDEFARQTIEAGPPQSEFGLRDDSPWWRRWFGG